MRNQQPTIAWTPELRALVLPRRGGEARPVEASDPAAAWARIRQVFARHDQSWRSSRSLKDRALAPVLRAILRKMDWKGRGLPPAEKPETEGALLAVLSVDDTWNRLALHDEVVTLWESTAGLAFAVEALQASLDFVASHDGSSEVWLSRKRQGGGVVAERMRGYRHWWYLRHRLAAAGEAEWEAARKTAERLRAGVPLAWRIPLAYLFPESGWPEEDANELLDAGANGRWQSGLLLPVVRDAGLVDELLDTCDYGWSCPPGKELDSRQSVRSLSLTMIDNLGMSAVAPLARLLAASDAVARRHIVDALAIVPSVESAEALAAHVELREAATALAGFAASYPRLAMPALAARAARGGPVVSTLLAQTVRRDPQAAAKLSRSLPAAARRAILGLLEERAELLPEADPGDLPPVLASPPRKRKKMPHFWQPDGFVRPLLRGRTAALPLSAVEALGVILATSPRDDSYAGLAQVREACDPSSLAAFAWDLFAAWLAAGAPNKEQWAFNALGHLGDDSCARRLSPLLRQWPGEGAHARAVAGLDVLRAIGTDVALMHLHGISQKVKSKGLQEKAQQKIEEIAGRRGLTPEDLADRLVPDLGLGADGTLVLDFGPRSFRVGFDESLKPFVRDGEEKRMADLPRPGRADDAERAKEAQEVWKTLKKDVKALAGHQILRLELAMCSRRRWAPDVFQAFFLEHPLLQHLVRRLVWGAWDGAGRLAATFRVSEDGSLADAGDEAWEMPDAVQVGIVHRQDLDDGLAARWGEVFADYEILQPFAQLGREMYRITKDEKKARELERLTGVTVATGKVLGLVERRGWWRGPAQDSGWIEWLVKPLPGGEHEVRLALDPGIVVGMVMEEPEQKLGTVTISHVGSWTLEGVVPFGALDAITFGELVRDLEGLRG